MVVRPGNGSLDKIWHDDVGKTILILAVEDDSFLLYFFEVRDMTLVENLVL